MKRRINELINHWHHLQPASQIAIWQFATRLAYPRRWLALGGWWPVQPVADDRRRQQIASGHAWRRATDGIIYVEMLEPKVIG